MLSAALASLAAVAAEADRTVAGPAAGAASNPGVPWPATDALGRALPLADEVGPLRPGRFVGIFYFLWHDSAAPSGNPAGGPYDIMKITAADPEALSKPSSPLWGPIGAYHFWGEPLYGYYRSDDPWVLRRHAQLLADAGVDTLIFDTTNAVTYRDTYRRLLEVFAQVRAEGGRTPQVAFMVNTEAGKTARQLYEDLYQPKHYPDLWFRWQGKPLLICDPKAADAELREFFTLRRAHWPFEMKNTPYAWHWEATYPQPYGYTDDPSQPEQVNVSVAQNLRASDGQVTNMSNGDARGRGFHAGRQDASAEAVDRGLNVAEQWRRALELGPPFVMVTGWNEWIAGRWGKADGPLVFVDQFDRQYSRDIEPMRDGHGDSYYYQMVEGIRRHKGAPMLPVPSGPATLRLEAGFEQWQSVGPEFPGHVGSTVPRDHAGVAGLHYTNRSGRNNPVAMKVARDATHAWFYVRTREALSSDTDPNWMWLLIDTDRDTRTGWQGFDFIVNRTREDGVGWLERNTGGWNWQRVAPVGSRVEGCELHLAIPRTALGLAPGHSLAIDFKWADNLQHPGDPLDFYLGGDTAPSGRFRFRYVAE
jgi:hypothetical protein